MLFLVALVLVFVPLESHPLTVRYFRIAVNSGAEPGEPFGRDGILASDRFSGQRDDSHLGCRSLHADRPGRSRVLRPVRSPITSRTAD